MTTDMDSQLSIRLMQCLAPERMTADKSSIYRDSCCCTLLRPAHHKMSAHSRSLKTQLLLPTSLCTFKYLPVISFLMYESFQVVQRTHTNNKPTTLLVPTYTCECAYVCLYVSYLWLHSRPWLSDSIARSCSMDCLQCLSLRKPWLRRSLLGLFFGLQPSRSCSMWFRL